MAAGPPPHSSPSVSWAGAGSLGMIWAQDVTGLLGADRGMLWRVPADFRHFRATTLGCGVVMGRRTWESLPGPLAGRRNVVLTSSSSWQAEGALPAPTLRSGLATAATGVLAAPDPRKEQARDLPRLWVIGGGSVYAQAMDAGLPDVLVVSVVDLDACSRARQQGLPESSLVRAPGISTEEWRLDPARSDPPGAWRERSGDARWRVETWRHR